MTLVDSTLNELYERMAENSHRAHNHSQVFEELAQAICTLAQKIDELKQMPLQRSIDIDTW